MTQQVHLGKSCSPAPSARRTVRRSAGFTLVEMLVILAIFAFIIAVSFPAVRTMIAKARLESAVQQTATVMYAARLQAIREATTAQVVIETVSDDEKWIWASIDRDRNGTFESDLGRVALDWKFQLAGPPTDDDGVDGWTGDRVEFRSDGSVAEPGAVRISATVGISARFYEVRVSPAAAPRIQVREWNGSKWVEEGDD